MNRLVLINPPMSLEERYGRLAGAGSTMPPLALCSLAAVCRKNGFKVAIIDAVREQITHHEIVERILKSKARYVGITAMTCGIHSAAQIAREVKQRDADIQTLIGGPHVTAMPMDIMQMFPEFDVGFIGEAEETLVDYLSKTDHDLKNVKGIVFRNNGNINRTEARPFIENLDSLPFPAWDMLPGFPGKYTPAAIRCKKLPASHLVTSRGCPMKCTFCDRSVFGNRYRFFSMEYVFEMIKILHGKFGVKDILFEDDSFTLQKSRVVSLCDLIVKNNLRLSWSCLGRVDSVDTELLTIMKKAGCWQIGFGIESGNSNVLDSVEKKTNLKEIREALALTKKSGIHTKGFFIAGLPHETQESFRETISFATSAALDDISVSFCTPFPGTVLHEKARSFGEFDPDWKKMNLMNAVFVPHGLSKKQLEEYHSRFLRSFYFRPRIILDYFFRIITDAGVFIRIVKSALVILVASGTKRNRL